MSDEQIHELVHELFSSAIRVPHIAADLRAQLTGSEASLAFPANDDVEVASLPADLLELTDGP